MRTPTIDELLRDPEPVTIRTGRFVDGKDEVLTFHLRVPNDVERPLAQGAANGARRALRAKLSDKTSEEYRFLLREPLEEADAEQLRSLWVNGKLIEAIPKIQFNSLENRAYVPEPEDEVISAEDRDAYEDAVEKVEERREQDFAKEVNEFADKLAEQSKKLSKTKLVDAATAAHMETLLSQEWVNEYSAQIIARCTFTDKAHTKPYFKTVEQARHLRSRMPHVYEELLAAHNGLMLPDAAVKTLADAPKS